MAKDPIFPLYYNDLDRSTKTWTDEEFGAYVRLLMEQWDKGFIPKDYQRLTRIATSLDKNWPLLKSKFVEVEGNFQNIRLEEIRAKKSKFKEKQRSNVLNRYQKPTKPPTKKLPLEIENEIESEIEKGSLEKSEKPFLKLVSVDWQMDDDFQSAYLTWVDIRGEDWRDQQHAATMKQLKDFTKKEAIDCLLKAIQGNYKTLYPSKENGRSKQSGKQSITNDLAAIAANREDWDSL
jgi:uncharacterized protein YdaU (DUF1376 family)